MKRIVFLPSILFIFSCGNEVKNEKIKWTPPSPPDSVVYNPSASQTDLISVVKEITISNVNQFINPESGLWLIQTPGAVPNMTNTPHVDKNFPVDFSAAKNEELPKVNCDTKSFWTKEGCFVQQVNNFNDEKIWTYCGLKKEDEAKIEKLSQAVSLTVINTSLHARYYFSQINGKWYLIFVDLRKPCAV